MLPDVGSAWAPIFKPSARSIRRSPLRRTQLSGTTVFDADYWATNLRNPVLFSQAIMSAGKAYGTFVEVSPHPLLTETIGDTVGSVDHEVLSSMNRHHPETLYFHLQLAAIAAQPNRSITSTATGGRLADIPRTPWHHVTHWLTDRSASSAFGGGHPLLGTHIEISPDDHDGSPPGPQVLLLSARNRESVNSARVALAAELAGDDDVNMSDVAFTLAGRRKDATRMAAVVHDRQHAVKVLQESEHENTFVGDAAAVESPLSELSSCFPARSAACRNGPRPVRERAGIRRALRPLRSFLPR